MIGTEAGSHLRFDKPQSTLPRDAEATVDNNDELQIGDGSRLNETCVIVDDGEDAYCALLRKTRN